MKYTQMTFSVLLLKKTFDGLLNGLKIKVRRNKRQININVADDRLSEDLKWRTNILQNTMEWPIV